MATLSFNQTPSCFVRSSQEHHLLFPNISLPSFWDCDSMGRSHNPHFHPTVFIRFLVLTIFISSILGSENVSLTTTNHGHLQFVVETRPRSVHILAAALVQSHYYRSYDRTKPSGHRRSSKAGTEHRLFTFVSRIPSKLDV